MNMMPLMPSSFPPSNITTDQIQKYLDENKKLILAILDNQNLGKLAECAQYQAQLQKNLMYLAAIADAQPQIATMPTQVSPPLPAIQQGAYFMNPAMSQPQGVFPPRMPTQFASPGGQPQQLHHQQAVPGQMNFRPDSGPTPTSAVGSDMRGGNKQEGPERGSSGDGQRNTGMGGEGAEVGK